MDDRLVSVINRTRKIPFMNRKLPITAVMLSVLIILSSCGMTTKPSETSTASATSSAGSSSAEAAITDGSTVEPVHMDHTFNPHCLSQIYVDKYGKDFEENFYRYCDAVLSGAETVKCDKKEWLAKFRDLSRIYLPIAFRYCYSMDEDITSAGNGEYKLSYGLPKDEYLKKVDEFKARIESLIESACHEGDTPFEMTLALYQSEGKRLTYDEAAADSADADPASVSLSPYRALMTDTGICQEIAGAYAYLLMQVGVDAITCGGLTKDVSASHEWTVVKIDGKYYHCDLTFQLNERATLRYFGMDDKQREIEGDWDMQYNNFGDTNDIWYKDLKLEDKRFEPLWTITSYKIDRENHKLCCYDSYECTGDLIVEIPLDSL